MQATATLSSRRVDGIMAHTLRQCGQHITDGTLIECSKSSGSSSSSSAAFSNQLDSAVFCPRSSQEIKQTRFRLHHSSGPGNASSLGNTRSARQSPLATCTQRT